MKESQYSIREEIKNFTLQNYIVIFIINVMIILAIIGYKGQPWAAIIYMKIVIILMLVFIYTCLIKKWKVDPSVIYYSMYFFNLLLCVAFRWWWICVCWAVILVCAGIGMDRYLKIKEKEKIENKK